MHNETVIQKVVKIVQELLLDVEERGEITPAQIRAKIDLVVSMNDKWALELNKEEAADELVRRFSIWMGQDSALKSDEGHQEWLTAARKRGWRYWQRYQEWLERKMSYRAVHGLDRSTDTILGLLEDPLREGRWDRRGLVVGHVQSGKTGNYTGLINKAADAGYKIIIVLAGLHNNLRSQTQMRLDEGFLGFETAPTGSDLRVIGVGEIDSDRGIRPHYATNRSEKGDFNTRISKQLGITPEAKPGLFVVKKNKTVLERLIKWLQEHVADTHDSDTKRKRVSHLPLLLIDDEADHASVDTGEQTFDETGKADEEHQPTAINRRVRRILHLFDRSAYVGYTATPFANIFIHERGETKEEGPDLFPAAFIVNLAAPSNYVGPARVFGSATVEGRTKGLKLIKSNDDHAIEEGGGWMPLKHKKDHVPLYNGVDTVPPSLVEAIDCFLLACAQRRLRGQESDHASMLIHVTRFTNVQIAVHRQVEDLVRGLRQRLTRRIDHEPSIARLRSLWEKSFVTTNEEIRFNHPDLDVMPASTWEQIEAVLTESIDDIQVRMINGKAKDSLDYAERKETGLKVIAVGGDKLARGLTLEGLSTSYFLRASKMYDTLMQMGRWFGYRPGYLDLCRLYMTDELKQWFEHIADAGEELREEFNLMESSKASPREYGLKVQSHSTLLVTSRLKMRTAKNLMISFSGQLLETIMFRTDRKALEDNLRAAQALISKLTDPEVDPKRKRNGTTHNWTGYLWERVPAGEVVDFLRSFSTHPGAYKVNSEVFADFIETMVAANELTTWTVGVIGGGEGAECLKLPGLKVSMLKRTNVSFDDSYRIGRLMSPRDETIDMDEKSWQEALDLTVRAWHTDPGRSRAKEPPDSPSGPAARKVKGLEASGSIKNGGSGLLLLYLLDPALAQCQFPPDSLPVVAFGIGFPGSKGGVKMEYKVNNVLWEQEYGPAQ